MRFFPVYSIALLACAIAQAQSYPEPFAEVNSVYGPRFYKESRFHTGVDYAAPAGTSIPAPAAGSLGEIRTEPKNNAGIRSFFVTADGIELGYAHQFTDTSSRVVPSGQFTLLKDYPLLRSISGGGTPLRLAPIYARCNVILVSGADAHALVDRECKFAADRKLFISDPRDGTLFRARYSIAVGKPIGVVGNSGSATTAPHLHLFKGPFGADNPLQVISHMRASASFCARLAIAGASDSACSAATTPRISTESLAARPYLDIRVDSTSKLDLDRVEITTTLRPSSAYSLRYGGQPSVRPMINGMEGKDAIIAATFLACADSPVPAPGRVSICVKDWKGERVPSSRLETTFRIGFDPLTVTPGSNLVRIQMLSVDGSGQTIDLPLMVEGGEPTAATLTVPGTALGWVGLPASITLTDLVPVTKTQFQLVANSSTCGSGERGRPLFSADIPDAAKFYRSSTTTAVPYQASGPGVNRRNCSSLVAVLMVPHPTDPSQAPKSRLWINATGRGQQFGGAFPLDWESQVRYDSGDPWTLTGRSCVGGTVANAGFFGPAWSDSSCSATLSF